MEFAFFPKFRPLRLSLYGLMSMLSAAMAFHPDAGAVCVMFLFPDRHGEFDFINDGTTGGESGISVGSAYSDGDGDFANLEMTSAVLTTYC